MSGQQTEEPTKSPYEFVQLVVYNIHGQANSRLVSYKQMKKALERGPGIVNAVCYIGLRGEPYYNFGSKEGFPNDYLRAIPSTLTQFHEYNGRVGHVLCDVISVDGEKRLTAPRAVAERALTELDALGFTLKSSSEIEFDLFEKETGKPFGNDWWANAIPVETNMGLFLDFIDRLQLAGVEVESLMTEAGPGTFEFTYELVDGIASGDQGIRLKNLAKVFFKTHGLVASFMTVPDRDKASSGWHFNHSLWTKNGLNAMVDKTQDHNMSMIARHWVAGLVKHGPALCALCCPTINCYRRIGVPLCPTLSDWGLDNRKKTFRVMSGPDNVYVENRLPSSACNPYLAIAATVAAGIDGLKNKLELSGDDAGQSPLPRDLESALLALEGDDVICSGVGEDLVKYFIDHKRTIELKPYSEAVGQESDDVKFKYERDLYFEYA